MNYLLDTNVVSELRKSRDRKANARVVAWIASEHASRFFISVLTILELERGVLAIQRRDPAQGARLRSWLDNQVRPEFAGRILPVDEVVATRCAHLHVPNRRNEADALIAATALVNDLAVVTRNIADFEGTGVLVIDPWQG